MMTVVLDSLFVAKCAKYLSRTRTEEFCYVSGPWVGHLCTPLCLLGVDYRSVSEVGVDVDPLSNTRQLSRLEKHGHTVLCTAHVHPGRGPRSVEPSATDYSTHRRFEGAGYRLIGLIFSRDGFLRAYSWQQEFRIIPYGKGLEQHGEELLRLV